MANKNNKALKEEIKKTHTLIKNYSYSQNGISLNFSLNVKNKSDLTTFVDLMVEAQKEVNLDILNLCSER